MKITKQQIVNSEPCSDGLEFAKSCNYNMVEIYENCERGDWMIWLLRKAKAIDKQQTVGIACLCARRSLVIFEKEYPKENRPRLAIEAAEKWVKNPTKENQKICDAAAYAAAYAAAAYAAAYAAADARKSERKWQADAIRKLISNPFK